MSLIFSLLFRLTNDVDTLRRLAGLAQKGSLALVTTGVALTTYWLFIEDGTFTLFWEGLSADNAELAEQTISTIVHVYIPVFALGATAGGIELAARRRIETLTRRA